VCGSQDGCCANEESKVAEEMAVMVGRVCNEKIDNHAPLSFQVGYIKVFFYVPMNLIYLSSYDGNCDCFVLGIVKNCTLSGWCMGSLSYLVYIFQLYTWIKPTAEINDLLVWISYGAALCWKLAKNHVFLDSDQLCNQWKKKSVNLHHAAM